MRSQPELIMERVWHYCNLVLLTRTTHTIYITSMLPGAFEIWSWGTTNGSLHLTRTFHFLRAPEMELRWHLQVMQRTPSPIQRYIYEDSGESSSVDSTEQYHLFYIDSSGILQETINSDGASIWDRGSLGNLNVIPSTSDSVGLTACSNERWNGANVPMEERTFELYYGGNDTLVHELIFNFGNRSWTSHSPFPNTQGNAGIACSASNASWSYVFLTNTENKLELWWKDSNNTAANNAARTTSHPLGIWSKGKCLHFLAYRSHVALNDHVKYSTQLPSSPTPTLLSAVSAPMTPRIFSSSKIRRTPLKHFSPCSTRKIPLGVACLMLDRPLPDRGRAWCPGPCSKAISPQCLTSRPKSTD